jgi:hypothetical protein
MGQRCDLCEENKYRDGFECPSMKTKRKLFKNKNFF